MIIVANLLTILRIISIPFIIWAFKMDDSLVGAKIMLWLFLAASFTDYLDGWVARKFDAGSKFGRMLDPIADKLLVATVLIIMVCDRIVFTFTDNLPHPRADLIPVIVIICREILVSGLREFLALEKIVMPVTKLAKWKTTFQFLALVALLWAPIHESFFIGNTKLYTQQCGQILLWLAALFTFITGWQYFRYTVRNGFTGGKILEIKVVDTDENK